jgi:hypothetical protein
MLAVSVTSIVLLFTMTLAPQAHTLIHGKVPAWLAWFLAVIFVLLESLVAVLLAVAVVLPGYMDHLFDRVLTLRGHSSLLEGRNASGCCKSLKAVCRVSIVIKFALLIGSLPIHAIPVVGTVAWLYLNGLVRGWESHQRYFDLKGWGYHRQKIFVRSRMSTYACFGTLALGLELIPGFGFLFMFTNVVGAALFASDIEHVISTRPVGDELSDLESRQKHSTPTHSTPTPTHPHAHPQPHPLADTHVMQKGIGKEEARKTQYLEEALDDLEKSQQQRGVSRLCVVCCLLCVVCVCVPVCVCVYVCVCVFVFLHYVGSPLKYIYDFFLNAGLCLTVVFVCVTALDISLCQ